MLKHLYKTFLVSILTWSLLMFNSAAVFAETKATVTTDSKGVISATKTHKFEKISDTDMLASLGMLAAGFITGRMLKNYKILGGATDVILAGAAGVAFIAGEIISNVKFKGTIDEMTETVVKKSDGTVNEEQIQRLKDLRQSYEEAKKTTKTKKTLQLASAAAFTAAAAIATYNAIQESMAAAACLQATTTSLTNLGTCPEGNTPQTSFYRPYCAQCATEVTAYKANVVKFEAARASPGPSLLEQKEISPAQMKANMPVCEDMLPGSITPPAAGISIAAACGAMVKMESMNQVFSYNPAALGSTNQLLDEILYKGNAPKFTYEDAKSVELKGETILNTVLDVFFPQAKASWLPMLGLSAATAASFFLITGETATQVDLYMFVPRNRAIAFAALAGVAYLSSKSSDNVIGKLDDNIKKIDAILGDMEKLTKGVKAQNLSNQSIAIKTVNPAINSASYSATGKTKSQCMANNSTENCASLTDQLKSMPGFAGLPDSFKDIATQSTTMADGLSGSTGVSGSTLTTAEALGNKQNAIAKVLKGQQSKLEKISNGKINFEKGKNDFLNSVKASVKKGLDKKGMSAAGMMASIGGTPIDSSANKNAGDDVKKLGAFEGNVVSTAPTGEAEKEKEDSGLKLEFKDNSAVGDATILGAPQVSGADQYDVKTDEINGQNGPSLFELITRRYIKSGYPKLLEEEPVKN